MFVEFALESDVLSYSLSRAPGVRLTVEGIDTTESISLQTVFWAEGHELDAFGAALHEDPTVRNPTLLTDTGSRRLFRIRYPDDSPDVALYRTGVELDSVALDITGDSDGWTVAAMFPDNDAFTEFREQCAQLGVDFSINAVYSEHDPRSTIASALTPRQRETLVIALECGYFTIPREASLAELADELDVSPQAVSERLRRGMASLIHETLADPKANPADFRPSSGG